MPRKKSPTGAKRVTKKKTSRRTVAKNAGKRRAAAEPVPVESIRHQDTRMNIPTQELRGFVVEDEASPKTLRWPRDPSLDPQLVWKGKDEQDGRDLEVPVVPIYIQEKIHPQALVENLRDTARPGQAEPELSLFDDFNGVEAFERKVEFYQHQGHWTNRMILGDSLTVMASLAEKEGLRGKVQMIYLDPPYGIKFGSNWQVSTRKRDVKDGRAEDATRQPEQVKAFRDTWELGIHSYLAYIRDRLTLARDLLAESGSLFVQIGDENVHLVRCLIDEVFGSESFVSLISFATSGGRASAQLPATANYLLWYARDKEQVKFRRLFQEKERGGTGSGEFSWVQLPNGHYRRMTRDENGDLSRLPPGSEIFIPSDLTSSHAYIHDPFEFQGKHYSPGKRYWSTSIEGMNRLALADRLIVQGDTLRFKRLFKDFPYREYDNAWVDTAARGFFDQKIYVVQTGVRIVERCLLMATDPGDLVFDPTCGSGTTAFVAEQWGRRWITIDTSRVALALARTRLMTGRYFYYLLADSPHGIAKEAELAGTPPFPQPTSGDVRKGFVYKRVPHVTLKSIANNPDIRDGMTREEIDAAIARHAEVEYLYDQPYVDNKRVRVTGPFTVESLSPHRILSADAERPAAESDGRLGTGTAGQQFETMVLDNLRKAGVQNTKKDERLVLDRLEPVAGRWIQGAGEYTDAAGKRRRVAISIGPEHGTVGPLQVREAAKEAVEGVGYDVLVVCGFAFDPHVTEEAKQYGRLTVLPARMNPDLAMGDELLKKTGAGNLFMVFGEPDLEVRKTRDGKLEVEIRGLDIYDPTTGDIRSSSTDDIACWFLDTRYDGESFFVRHAYFTGAGDPYEKLRRALRAEIEESAWESLYRTVSRPFDPPPGGKIAVKVINHYGDEVLKVLAVG